MLNKIPKVKFMCASIFVVTPVFTQFVDARAHKHTHIRCFFPFDLSFFPIYICFSFAHIRHVTLESKSIDSIISSISHFHIAQSIHLADKRTRACVFCEAFEHCAQVAIDDFLCVQVFHLPSLHSLKIKICL